MDDSPATGVEHLCDYRHDDGHDHSATWGLIGEAGDFYVCDEHFAMRTEAGRKGWHRLATT